MANRTKTSSSKNLSTAARTVKISALNQNDGATEDETVLLQGKKGAKKGAKKAAKKRAPSGRAKKAAVAASDGRLDPHPHVQLNGSLPVHRHIVV